MSLARRGLTAFAVALLGALAGILVGLRTPAHVEIAGSDTRLWLQVGRHFDQVGVGGLISARRPTTRTVMGEPLGVRADITLDTTGLVNPQGQFDSGILPGYIQVFSDPEQVVEDCRRALFGHFIAFSTGGAGMALALLAAGWLYRRWRTGYDRKHFPEEPSRQVAIHYRAVERTLMRRAFAGLAVLTLLAGIPSADRHASSPTILQAEPILDGTPLAGTQIDGLLRPAFVAAQSYIQTYFNRTDNYYSTLLSALKLRLADNPTTLPDVAGRSVTHFGFVTDRHCNIGMDRVIVGLLRSFRIKTLVSAGDDALSGSFGFESACTRNLADKTAQAGITDVFAGGNHDSPDTITAQRKQRIKTLEGKAVTVDGLTFLGSPDPRTSRYGQGIVPASNAAQDLLVSQQGAAIGRTACNLDGPVIAVLHDSHAGESALASSCGHIPLALDGHTHVQAGPDEVSLGDGTTGYRFTGGSAGGAPAGPGADAFSTSRLTVGPLHHQASVNLVSVDAKTGALVGVTVFTFDTDQTITVTQQMSPG